jgi:DUF2933 family protein
MQHDDNGDKPGFFACRANIVLIGFLAIAGFYLITEHNAHLLGWLPWLLLLACPLMHFFMHGGHGDHGGNNDGRRRAANDRQTSMHQH